MVFVVVVVIVVTTSITSVVTPVVIIILVRRSAALNVGRVVVVGSSRRLGFGLGRRCCATKQLRGTCATI